MFDDVWGLPWRVTNKSDRYQGSYTVNPLLRGFDTPALVKQCSFPGKPIDKVALEDAVYLPLRFAKKLANANANAPPPPARTCETHAAFAKVGQGRVGYIGDSPCGLRERATTDLILAMCFWPGSHAPVAPGEIAVPGPALPVRPSGPRPRDAEVAARAAAGKKACEDKRKRADKLKDKGNDFFKREKWYEAAEKYRDAAFLGGPQPVYLANLAACLLKLKQWEIADSAASRALAYDPRHVKALYRRAVARRELARSKAALADLEWLLTIDKHNAAALKEKAVVLQRFTSCLDWPGDQSARSLRDQDVALDVEEEPDEADCWHPGTGVPCRDHNTSETGCPNGSACRLGHTPDTKSVRDELGRSVCVYWLLGHCRFSATSECVYAHDATYLPERGWWTDTARLERMRAEFDAAVEEEPLDLGDGPVEERILAEAFVLLPWQKDVWAVEAYEDDEEDSEDYGLGSIRDSEDNSDSYVQGSGDDDDDDDYDYDVNYRHGHDEEDHEENSTERGELNEYGVTNADVEEMWEYGIKPWEDGAYAEMLRIRRALRNQSHF